MRAQRECGVSWKMSGHNPVECSDQRAVIWEEGTQKLSV